MTVKLLDKESKQLVDFEPNSVNAAVDSGRFLFPKGRGVPVRAEGSLKYIAPEDAAKYRDRLLFVNDEDVERGKAEERFGGIGGAAQALAYGGVKGLTLGTAPALASALSPEFAEYSKQIELGRPGLTAVGEFGSLAVDPFAVAGKALGLGAKAGREAAQGAGAAAGLGARAAGQAAPSLGREALAGIEAAGARQVEDVAARQAAQRGVVARQPAVSLGEQTAMAGEVSPPILGRQALTPTAEEAANLAAEQAARREAMLGRARGAAQDEVEAMREEQSLAYRPLTGPTSQAEPGLRLGMDPYQTPELAMRARQAEELRLAGISAREGEAARAADAASLERGLPPGAQGPVEDFGQMPGSAMESDYLKSELARIDDALEANAAAARKARSPASRDRVGAERERLLAERERFDVDAMRTGMRADEDLAAQAERAYQAAQFQAQAPDVAAQAAQLGRRAEGLEAAQTVTPMLGRAATRVEASTTEGARALGDIGTVERGAGLTPSLGRTAVGQDAAAAMRGAEGLAPETLAGSFERMGGTLAEGPVAQGAQALPGRGLQLPEGMASMAAQGGLYGASEEARRQATGESQGGMGAILGAGALGAAIPAGLMLGGKMLSKGAGAAGSMALGGAPGSASQRFAKAAGGVEDAHILRMFGISNKQVERLNNQFTEAGIGQKGTANFSDFIKREVSNLEELKTHLPDNEILQLIPTGQPIKFGQLTPERRTAIAEAVKAKLGKQYDELLPPELMSLSVSNDALKGIVDSIQATAVKGLGSTQFKTIAPELNAFRNSIARGQEMTVGELRQMRKTLDDIFSARNGGFDKKFTSQQSTFRNAVDDVVFSALDSAAPGTSAAVRALNKEYTMAGILERGAQAAETKAATTSPIGRDLLSQAALGVAIGNPVGAATFFVGSTMLRGVYNSRGDGIIADLAGKAERAALRIQQDPVQAARQATTAIIDSRRPMLLGASAQQLTSAEPADYAALSRSVRELKQSREKALADVQRSVAGLPPEEQQKAIQNFDNVVNALASEMPKGLAMDKAINEQERRYTVFARSVLDPAYATQVLVNGGADADEAAHALKSLGPQGQEYLQNLADGLRDKINESEKLRGDQQLQQVYRNIKSKVSVSIGGGRRGHAGSIATIHGLGKPGLSPSPMVSATTQKNMAAALGGTSKTLY